MFRLMYGRKVLLLTIYSIICPLAFENNLMENLDKIRNTSIFVTIKIILSHYLLLVNQSGNGCNILVN